MQTRRQLSLKRVCGPRAKTELKQNILKRTNKI